jgi:hypothetical protein
MESHDAITAALKGIVPIAVSVAFVAVTVVSLRVKREDVAWWQRGVAWLAIAKGTRFVLEWVVCAWIALAGDLHGAAMTYQATVCTLYLATVPLLVITALRLLRGDSRARRSGGAVALTLVAVETGLWVARRLFVPDETIRNAIGIAAVSMRGSAMMTAEAIVIGIVASVRRSGWRS